MRSLRRYLVPLLLMLPVIFVCGKLLLTPVAESKPGLASLVSEYDRGWPWVYSHEWDDQRNLTMVSSERGIPAEFRVLPLLADLLVLAGILVVYYGLLLRVQRRSLGWRRFSLRALLLLVTLIGAVAGWWMSQVKQSRDEYAIAAAVRSSNKSIYFGDELRAPQWLRRLAPQRYLTMFNRPTYWAYSVGSQTDLPAELRSAIAQLSRLRALRIFVHRSEPHSPSPQRISYFDSLRKLEELELGWGVADDETLSILDSLPNLRSLEIEACPITDEGVAIIGRCQTLENLVIQACPSITAAGLAHLAGLDRLTSLSLHFAKVDDASIDSLLRIKSLKEITLIGSGMTDDGVRRLVKLPNLRRIELQCLRTTLKFETLVFLESHVSDVEIHPMELKIEPSQLPKLTP